MFRESAAAKFRTQIQLKTKMIPDYFFFDCNKISFVLNPFYPSFPCHPRSIFK